MNDNKKFWFIQKQTNFYEQPAIDYLFNKDNALKTLFLYDKLCLETANTEGELITILAEKRVPYTLGMIERMTKQQLTQEEIKESLNDLLALNLISRNNDDVYKVLDHVKMVGSITQAGLNKRMERERKKSKSELAAEGNVKVENNILKAKYFDNLELNQAFIGWLEMRIEIKSPPTKKAIEMAINNLNKLSNNIDEQIEIVNKATLSNWKSFFPIKKYEDTTNQYNQKQVKDVFGDFEFGETIGGVD